MRYAIFSDVHSNLEALERVLEKIDEMRVDRVLNLGDLVGYYASPNECVDAVRERAITSIMGNHDVVACGRVEPVYFNPTAAAAVLWSRETLTDSNREWIRALPDSLIVDDSILMVHGSVRDRDEYLLFRPEIESSFESFSEQYPTLRVAFFGHTHRRIYYEDDGNNLYAGTKAEKLVLRPGGRYLINPGSVGQPRDGDPRAAFCVYDAEAAEVSFYRVPFDIDRTAERIRALPFGDSLARRLYRGI